MLYQHRFFGDSEAAGLPPRRFLSLWGLGAALGLLSFPLRARSSEPDSSEPELAGEASELCSSASLEGLPELCDSAAEAEFARDPALLSVLGGDVRPDGLSDLVLSQAPEGTAAGGGGGLFGLSWPVVALAGGGAVVGVAVVASGGSDSDDSGGGGGGGGDSNSAPVTTTLAMTSLTVDEAAAETWTLSDWFSDPDGDTLTYTETGLPAWLELDTAMGELTIAADATDDGDVDSHVFTITASDDDDESVELKVTLTVENVAETPTLTDEAPTSTDPFTVAEAAAVSWTLADWFEDPDTGDTLTFTATGLPAWLVLNSAMTELAIAASATDDAQVGSHVFTVTATDAGDLKVTHTVTLEVENVAEDPVTTTLATTSLTAMEGSATAMNWTVSTWFSDEDTALPSSPDSLTYTATGLPDWLTLNGATGVLTIAARATDDVDIGTYVLEVTASDTADAMVAHTTTLTITDTENEPVLSAALPNRIAPLTGMTLMLDLADFFTDFKNDGTTRDDELTFTVSESIPGTGAENIVTAVLTGSMLTLTPGEATGFGQQETVSITVTDSDDKQTVAAFAVTTRANVLDVGDLTPALGFIIQGDVADDQLGRSVSGAGDVNGDGLADLITGAELGDDEESNAGEAYIVYGKTGTTGTQFGTTVGTTVMRQVLDTTSLTLADGFIIQGDRTNDRLGNAVSGAGDINGDGIDDLIIGANNGDDGGERAGEAYIVYGKAGTQFGTAVETVGGMRQVVDTTNLAAADGFILQGDASRDRFGFSVAGAGDINGDGIDDLIVGAYWGDDGGQVAGEAYIVYGKTGDGSQFGMAVRVAADGTTPLDITASDAVGSVVRQVLDTSMLAPAAGFILQGDVMGDFLGASVSGAGDINGDGIDDLIVGAYLGNDGGDDAGEAYIVYGKPNPAAADGAPGTQFGTLDGTRQVLDTTSLSVTDGFILQGDAGNDNLGRSVSGAGDINGDGLDDLIVGAYLGDDGAAGAGEAYIVYGKPNPAAADGGPGTQFGTTDTTGEMRQVLDTSMLAPAAGFIIQGGAMSDELGISVSGAGDVNGDGLADLIVGSYRSDNNSVSDAGEAYIVYGKAGTDGTQFGTAVRVMPNGETIAEGAGPVADEVSRQVLDMTDLAPSDGFIIQGGAMSDELGVSVSGAGDVNGDGFDDLITGAPNGDDGGEDAGEAYVVYGGTHLGEVVSHDQTLVGAAMPTLPDSPTPAQQEAAARAAFLHGGAGNDQLEAHADTTVLYGGAGDDVLELADASFLRVDGGSGNDRLVLGTSLTLDLTDASVRGKVRGIETLSLSDGADATLDLLSVYALVESRNNGGEHTSAGEAFLRLEGVGMVVLEGGTWTPTPDADGPDLYVQGSAKLLIDDGLIAA